MTGEEVIFGIVRRRESIKSLAAQKRSPLPASMTQASWRQGNTEEEPIDHLKKDLVNLDIKKQQHLSIPNRKGGKKMNRLSLFGLFIGLLAAGTIFFIAGFLMCYSFYPPYGGIIFHPKYASVSAGQALPISAPDALPMPDVPQHSYSDRQALLASANGTEKPGVLEKAQQRTRDNVTYQMGYMKDQIKDLLIQGVRSVTNKLGDKVAPTIGNIAAPITEDLPNQIVNEQISTAFDNIPESRNKARRIASANSALSFSSPGKKGPPVLSASSMQSPAESTTSSPSSLQKSNLYSVRVRKFDERESALKLAEELKRKGFEGYIVPLWNVDHLEFDVRSGGYEKFSDAQNAAKVLREQGLELTSVVMTGRDEEQIRP